MHDILAKVHGSTNPVNVTRATLNALMGLRSVEELSRQRGVKLRLVVPGQPAAAIGAAGRWPMPGKLRVTQTRSTISHIARNRATIRALGLHGIGSSSVLPDNEAVRGMVRQVRFLVTFEELPEGAKTPETK